MYVGYTERMDMAYLVRPYARVQSRVSGRETAGVNGREKGTSSGSKLGENTQGQGPAMEVVMEMYNEDRIAHPWNTHIFAVLRLMTHLWRKSCLKMRT